MCPFVAIGGRRPTIFDDRTMQGIVASRRMVWAVYNRDGSEEVCGAMSKYVGSVATYPGLKVKVQPWRDGGTSGGTTERLGAQFLA